MNIYDNFNNHNGALKVIWRAALGKRNARSTRENKPYYLSDNDCCNGNVTNVIKAVIGH